MAHVPGHLDPLDPAIAQAGLAGAQPPERVNPRPSLFDANAQTLFGELQLGAGGRSGDLLGRLIGGFLPPSKKQKAAFAKLTDEREEARRRALVNATTELAVMAGVSPAAAGMAGGFDPAAAAAIQATARGEEGGRQALESVAARAQLETLKTTGDARERRLANLPIQVQQKVEEISREARAEQITNRRDFIADVEQNPALSNSSKSLVAADKLLEIMEGDFTALDLTQAAVLFTQVSEPGLAVREDDRMAFTRAATSGFENMKNTLNQFAEGTIDGEQAKANVTASLFSVMRPVAQGVRESVDFWRRVGTDIPGVKIGDVVGAAGITQRQLELIEEFSLVPGTSSGN